MESLEESKITDDLELGQVLMEKANITKSKWIEVEHMGDVGELMRSETMSSKQDARDASNGVRVNVATFGVSFPKKSRLIFVSTSWVARPAPDTSLTCAGYFIPGELGRVIMLLDVNQKLFSRSDRVKAVDFHPSEPWLLTGLYNGSVNIYNVDTGALIKTFEVAEVPVRCVRFIPRKNWFVAGSDDFLLRIFNYNTHDKVTSFEAHPEYIRCLTVHPTASIVLTGSDDMTIKAWDWDKNWTCIQMYEGHTHYIMNLAINPKDPTTFASSSLDQTVKIWSLTSGTANFTLDAHGKGVNYVEFYPGPDKSYLVTTGDDRSVKIWDYVSKSCVQTMEGHSNNVSFAVFHPSLPIIVSGSEDGTVKIWNSATYSLENTLSYELERAWCVALKKGSNDVAVGYDEGVVVVKVSSGNENPGMKDVI